MFHIWQVKLVGKTSPGNGRRFAVWRLDQSPETRMEFIGMICDFSAPDTNASILWNMWICSPVDEFLFPVRKPRELTHGLSWRNRTSAKAEVVIRRNFTLSQYQQTLNSMRGVFLVGIQLSLSFLPSMKSVMEPAGGRLPPGNQAPAPYQKAWTMRNSVSF